MAMGSRGNRGDRNTMSEINVTPLVDVMLVLLVIFMITAPMMQQGVQVNLPKAETKALNPQEETVVVSVEKSGRIFIDKSEVVPGDLGQRLSAMFANRSKKEVFLKADKDVPYGDVVRTMAEIKAAGIERLGMVTEPAQKK
ncbi:protein TolR [Geobacter sp. DSM 9736]|uniref:protein TolR n=1 Tax=Geobacter sp. DSM 9736 TaxID=1277350 RepID=UPI000B503F78|nr:protein TolR [Geobacter sp. DSM 9736]SNB47200.1 Cell division and transport-associated protein TolR [Geobacter sp. DSM 9736]